MKIKALHTLAFCTAALAFAVAPASADVHLTIQNGRVSIVAKDATVRQILTEWARVGQTKIVNVERIPGGPVTLELNNVAEAQALDILLRTMSGYIAAPRPATATAPAANLSQFDRVIVMPTLASARPPVSAAPPPVFQPTAQYSQPQQVANDDQEEEQQVPPNVPAPPVRGPVFNTFPTQPTVIAPQVMPQQQGMPQQAPATNPTAAPAPGVSVPGMIVQPPQQPGQPQPGMPGAPVRRPGGQ